MVYPYSGILLSHKKEWSSDKAYNMDELENTMLSEISQTKRTNTV